MRHSETNETAATAPATSRARALVPAMSGPPISAPAAIGPTSWPSEAPMVKWPKLRSWSCGADWRATIDWAPITKAEVPEAHHTAPRGHRGKGVRRTAEGAAPGYEDDA